MRKVEEWKGKKELMMFLFLFFLPLPPSPPRRGETYYIIPVLVTPILLSNEYHRRGALFLLLLQFKLVRHFLSGSNGWLHPNAVGFLLDNNMDSNNNASNQRANFCLEIHSLRLLGTTSVLDSDFDFFFLFSFFAS